MNDAWVETLSRLIDGEDVDVGILANAIESTEGRRLLVDFATIRAAARQDRAVPSDDFYRRLPSMLASTSTMRRPQAISYRLAAALVAAAALLGFGLDLVSERQMNVPPRADRVLRFEASEWTMVKGSGS